MELVIAARKAADSHCALSWPMPKLPMISGIATLITVIERAVEMEPTITVLVTILR